MLKVWNYHHGYNIYFINAYVFHTKDYNIMVYIKGSNSNNFEVDYYGKLKEIIQL